MYIRGFFFYNLHPPQLFQGDAQMNFASFLSFRNMITPTIVQIVFVIGLIVNALSALGVLIAGITQGFGGFLAGLVAAIVILVVGSLLIRITANWSSSHSRSTTNSK